jgi:hypothetical protein
MTRSSETWRAICTTASIVALCSACGIQIDFGSAKQRECRIRGNDVAKNSGIQYEIADPYRCVYTISFAGSPVDLLVGLFAPSDNYAGRSTLHTVTNNVGDVLNSVVAFWELSQGCTHACIIVTGQFPGGTGVADGNGVYRDYFRSSGHTPTNAFAEFETELTGTVGFLADIGGGSFVQAPYDGQWQANVNVDTLSFRYRWYVNGAPLGATGRTLRGFPYGESGGYTLTAIVQLMDQTTDTATINVSVGMGAAWSGPTAIGNGELGTWTAIAYAARSPLSSCEWYVNGSLVEPSACTLYYSFSEAATTNTIDVQVTDARGVTATGSNSVWVFTSGCYPPTCYEELRAPVAPSKGSRRGGRMPD